MDEQLDGCLNGFRINGWKINGLMNKVVDGWLYKQLELMMYRQLDEKLNG